MMKSIEIGKWIFVLQALTVIALILYFGFGQAWGLVFSIPSFTWLFASWGQTFWVNKNNKRFWLYTSIYFISVALFALLVVLITRL